MLSNSTGTRRYQHFTGNYVTNYTEPLPRKFAIIFVTAEYWYSTFMIYETSNSFSWLYNPSRPRPPLLIVGVSKSHSDTQHSVGLFWTTDRPVVTHNIHNRQTSIPPAGFEPTIPASEWLQTHALDRAATVIDRLLPATLCDFSNSINGFTEWPTNRPSDQHGYRLTNSMLDSDSSRTIEKLRCWATPKRRSICQSKRSHNSEACDLQ